MSNNSDTFIGFNTKNEAKKQPSLNLRNLSPKNYVLNERSDVKFCFNENIQDICKLYTGKDQDKSADNLLSKNKAILNNTKPQFFDTQLYDIESNDKTLKITSKSDLSNTTDYKLSKNTLSPKKLFTEKIYNQILARNDSNLKIDSLCSNSKNTNEKSEKLINEVNAFSNNEELCFIFEENINYLDDLESIDTVKTMLMDKHEDIKFFIKRCNQLTKKNEMVNAELAQARKLIKSLQSNLEGVSHVNSVLEKNLRTCKFQLSNLKKNSVNASITSPEPNHKRQDLTKVIEQLTFDLNRNISIIRHLENKLSVKDLIISELLTGNKMNINEKIDSMQSKSVENLKNKTEKHVSLNLQPFKSPKNYSYSNEKNFPNNETSLQLNNLDCEINQSKLDAPKIDKKNLAFISPIKLNFDKSKNTSFDIPINLGSLQISSNPSFEKIFVDTNSESCNTNDNSLFKLKFNTKEDFFNTSNAEFNCNVSQNSNDMHKTKYGIKELSEEHYPISSPSQKNKPQDQILDTQEKNITKFLEASNLSGNINLSQKIESHSFSFQKVNSPVKITFKEDQKIEKENPDQQTNKRIYNCLQSLYPAEIINDSELKNEQQDLKTIVEIHNESSSTYNYFVNNTLQNNDNLKSFSANYSSFGNNIDQLIKPEEDTCTSKQSNEMPENQIVTHNCILSQKISDFNDFSKPNLKASDDAITRTQNTNHNENLITEPSNKDTFISENETLDSKGVFSIVQRPAPHMVKSVDFSEFDKHQQIVPISILMPCPKKNLKEQSIFDGKTMDLNFKKAKKTKLENNCDNQNEKKSPSKVNQNIEEIKTKHTFLGENSNSGNLIEISLKDANSMKERVIEISELSDTNIMKNDNVCQDKKRFSEPLRSYSQTHLSNIQENNVNRINLNIGPGIKNKHVASITDGSSIHSRSLSTRSNNIIKDASFKPKPIYPKAKSAKKHKKKVSFLEPTPDTNNSTTTPQKEISKPKFENSETHYFSLVRMDKKVPSKKIETNNSKIQQQQNQPKLIQENSPFSPSENHKKTNFYDIRRTDTGNNNDCEVNKKYSSVSPIPKKIPMRFSEAKNFHNQTESKQEHMRFSETRNCHNKTEMKQDNVRYSETRSFHHKTEMKQENMRSNSQEGYINSGQAPQKVHVIDQNPYYTKINPHNEKIFTKKRANITSKNFAQIRNEALSNKRMSKHFLYNKQNSSVNSGGSIINDSFQHRNSSTESISSVRSGNNIHSLSHNNLLMNYKPIS